MARLAKPWALLSSHGLVLVAVSRYPNLTIARISEKLRLGRGTVIRVLQDLESAGMVRRERRGRQNTYEIDVTVRFRHPIMSDRRIDTLLAAFPPAQPPSNG